MNISIFELGYVGCVSATCLVRGVHEVIGVNINNSMLGLLSQGKSPIVELGLDVLIGNAVHSGCLRVTNDHTAAIREN